MSPLGLRRSPLAQTAARLLLLVVVVGLVFAPLSTPAAQATPAAAITRDSRFGLNEAWRAAEAADRAGAGWSRILFWWSEMQKDGPGGLNLFATDQDAYINNEADRGRLLVGAVLNTPPWASADGSRNGVPNGLYLPYDHPDNTWGQFMRLMAQHYKGRIDTWIIWNEVDISHGQWATWNGSLEEYVQLQKVAYKAIKAGNPNATVLPFGAAWWYDYGATISRMLDLLKADPEAAANNYYFDAANLHLYSRAADIPRIVGWYRAEMAARGMMSKPIWIGETNAIPYDDAIWRAPKANFRASMDEQASYIIQAFATYVGLGVERIGVNRTIDGTDFEAGGEPFGLLRNDGSTRPAFTSYQVATRYFAGVHNASLTQDAASGVTRVVMQRAGERVTVLWTMSPGGSTATIDAQGGQALKVSKWGDAEPISAAGGKYTIGLAPATANSNEHDRADYVVGGDPVILVERTDGNVMAAYRSLDDIPVPGPQVVEAAAASDAPIMNQPQPVANPPQQSGSKKATATPTPTPKKATPTPTPKKR
ncbi:MAG: hypothetical protein IT306_06440 [Chloroflexi bacterium]|nr:hypothetical protein [Chloroflexota bacterium]